MPASSEVVAGGFTYNNSLVEGYGTFNPASEDEIIEVKALLAEPESVKISMDALLCYDNDYLEKCLGIGDVSGSSHQNSHCKSDTGTMQFDIPLYHDDLVKANFLVKLLHGVKEEDLHVTGGLSSASDELILDTKYIAKFPNLENTCEGVRSVSLDTCSPGLSGRVIDSSEALDLSSGTINPAPKSTLDQSVPLLDKLTTHELHLAYRGIFGLETTVKDREWLFSRISLGLQNYMHLKCSNDSHGANSSFESCSPGLSKRITDGAEALNLSAGTFNPVPKSTSDQNAFRSTFGFETTVKDRKWLISRISLGMQKFVDVENCSGFLESGVSSAKHEVMHLICNNDSHGTNSSSESCSSSLREWVTDGAETLDLSAGTIPVSESTSDQNGLLLEKLTTWELQYAFKSTFGLETTVMDRKWLIKRILIGLQTFIETENVWASREGKHLPRNL
ncbi:hypothetical protein MKX01_013354 [Papaver californicum]|nr:hypothetical protein MKX01_013354 [Papaver californicum]